MKLGFIYRLLELQTFLNDTEAVNEALIQPEESIVGSRAEDEGTLRQAPTSVPLRNTGCFAFKNTRRAAKWGQVHGTASWA